MGQCTQGEQFTELFADRRHAYHRRVRDTGVVLADPEYVVAILIMHLTLGADLKREVDVVDFQPVDLPQSVEGNGINTDTH